MAQQWQTIRERLSSRKIADGADLAKARAELFQALSDRVCRIDGIKRAAVRTADKQSNGVTGLKYAATSGPNWTDELRGRRFPIYGPSLGAKVVRDNAAHGYVPNAKAATDSYERLFDDVNCVFCASIRGRERIVALVNADSEHSGLNEQTRAEILKAAADCAQVLDHFALLEDRWIMDVLAQMAKTRSVGEVCETAVTAVKKIFGVVGASLFLYDAAAMMLRLRAYTRKERQDRDLSYRLGEGLTGWVGLKKRVLRLHDYTNETELSAIDRNLTWKNLSGYNPKESNQAAAFLAVPLVNGDNLIGVIRLANKRDHADFVLEDEEFLSRIGDYLALKIDNFDAQNRQIDRFKSLAELGTALSGTTDLKHAGKALVKHLPTVVGAKCAIVRRLSRDQLDLVASSDPDIQGSRPAGSPLVGAAAETRTPAYYPELATAEGGPRDAMADPALKKYRRGAFLPLIAEDRPVGTLSLLWEHPAEFSMPEKQMIEDLAHRAAVSIEVCNLFTERTTMVDEIHDVGLNLIRDHDVDHLFLQILVSAQKIAQVPYGTVRSLSDDGEHLVARAATGDLGEKVAASHALAVAALPEVRDALTGRVPKLIPNTKLLPSYLSLLRGLPQGRYRSILDKTKSMILVPIRLGDETIAMIFLDSDRELTLSPAMQKYLEILAGYAAIAVDNAKLHAERERSMQLQAPLALMGGMLSGYLHQLRNPLQAISAHLALLGHPQTRPEAWQDHTRKLEAQVNRLQHLAKDLTKLAQAQMARTLGSVDLTALAMETIAANSGAAEKAGVSLRCDCPGPVVIQGNEAMLKIAVQMLIQNAFEAMEAMPKRELIVATTSSADARELIVRDTGKGMDPDMIRSCKEVFVTDKPTGTGLGLAIVDGLARRLGGRIEITSEPGKGTSVRLIFGVGNKETR